MTGAVPAVVTARAVASAIGDARRKCLFVLEQSLSHAAYATMLERAAGRDHRIDPTILRVFGHEASPWQRVPPFRSLSFRGSWEVRRGVRRELAVRRPHALYIHSQVVSLLAVKAMRSVPTVISLDATPANFDSIGRAYGHGRQSEPAERMKLLVNRRALLAARAVVAWSRWAADSLVSDYGVPAERVHVIRPGVDLEIFRPGARETPNGPLRILFVGGDFERKGGRDLFAAMGELAHRIPHRRIELDVVCSGRVPQPVTARFPMRIHADVRPHSPELVDLYQRSDLFVLPTHGDCSPHVVAEAMACGCPVVATALGAIGEVVHDGANGVLVPPGSPRRLADALAMLVEDPHMRRRMAAAALRTAQDEHDSARNTAALFDLLLAQGGSASRRVVGTP